MPDRRRSSTATRSLSTLFRRGSYMAKSATDDTSAVASISEKTNNDEINDTLETLSSKSTQLSHLSQKDMVLLCNEVLYAIQSKSDEWTKAGDWIIQEMKLTKFLPDDYKPGEEITDASVQTVASATRFNMGSIAGGYISSVVKGIQGNDEAGIKGKKKNENVYGPISMGAALPGHSFEVWTDEKLSSLHHDIQKEIGEEEEKKEENDNVMPSSSAEDSNGVALVLGAGNQSFLTLIDALHQCLVCRRTVLIKHHPLRPYLIAPFSILLEPLIERGYVAQIVDGGIPQTSAILSNNHIRHVHLTGSKTTDTAVKETIRRSRPYLSKIDIESMVTSELGCATPWIVTPGKYTPTEIINAARMIAASKKGFGGCNCLSAQVVALPSEWSGKNDFRKELTKALQGVATNASYYPGSRERKEDIVQHYHDRYGDDENNRVTTIKGSKCVGQCNEEDEVAVIECGTVGEDGFDGTALIREAFGPVLAIVEFPGGCDDDDGAYLTKTVVPFVNDKSQMYGSLSCTLLTPDSLDKAVTESAVSALNYGTVSINSWSVSGYFSITAGGVWGAHPTDTDGQSGKGHIGNAYSIPHISKGVIYGPSLAKEPLFTEKAPPAIVLDAIHAVTCSTTILKGMMQLWKMLFVRSFAGVLSPILKLVLGIGWRSSYGSAI